MNKISVFLGIVITTCIYTYSQSGVKPTSQQIDWHEREFISIVHFGPNTYLNTEWSDGSHQVNTFWPDSNTYDPDQWIQIMKAAGIKLIVMVAKHHDGFCLFQTQYSQHSLSNPNAWGEGKADVLKDVFDAARRHGLEVGLYNSPWDRNYSGSAVSYNDYFANQIENELMINYGEIKEGWFDGAGASAFDWNRQIKLLKSLDSNMVIFNTPDIRWAGNEDCHNNESGGTYWNTQIYTENRVPELQGQEIWWPKETDCSLQQGAWFRKDNYRSKGGLNFLIDRWHRSVGYGAVLNIGIAPNKSGRVDVQDSSDLVQFGEYLQRVFKYNLAHKRTALASNVRGSDARFRGDRAVDNDKNTYWTVDPQLTTGSLEIDLGQSVPINMVMIQEYIPNGQYVSGVGIDAWVNNQWVEQATATTVGYKRTIRFNDVTTDKVRLRITGARESFYISNFAVYDQQARTPISSLSLTSPNGGETWQSGIEQTITWENLNVNNVTLEYSSNSGVTWTPISTGIDASLGQYIWTPPSEDSRFMKIRIVSEEDGNVMDESNADFSVPIKDKFLSRISLYLENRNLFIKGFPKNFTLKIFNTFGKLVLERNGINKKIIRLPKHIVSGLYLINIQGVKSDVRYKLIIP